jgi:GNAT superfamily N-acetyltransferase
MLEVRDREFPDRHLAWIRVELTETRDLDEAGTVFRGGLTLACRVESSRRWGHGNATFEAGYCSLENAVKLTSTSMMSGAVFFDPPGLRGNRVGTYLMDQIVHWVRQWPDASVIPITLVAGQGRGADGLRRNRFYEQFGIEFDYTTPEKLAGESRPMLAGKLRQSQAWMENISVHDASDDPSAPWVRHDTVETEETLQAARRARQDVISLNEAASPRLARRATRVPYRWTVYGVTVATVVAALAFL